MADTSDDTFTIPTGKPYQAQIDAACDWLVAKGEKPTYVNVRQAMRGGSNSTLGPAIKAWLKARNAEPQSSAEPEPAPEFVSDEVTAMAAKIWAAANSKANERLKTERDAMAATKAEWEAREVELGDLTDVQEGELTAEKERVAALTQEHEQLRKQLQDVSEQLMAEQAARSTAETNARVSGAALEQARADLTEERKGREAAAADLRSERTARTAAEEAHRKEAARVGKLEGHLDAAHDTARAAKSELEVVRAQAMQAAQDAAELRGKLQQIEATAAAAAAENERVRGELDSARAEVKAATSEAAALRGQLQAHAQRENGPGKAGSGKK